jgi:MYXO-CTERM domain-containing protein
MCYFSSAGPLPSGWPKPEISAPGGFVAAAMSFDADPRRATGGLFDAPGCEGADHCYVVDDFHAITAGSSMSAPHVTGAVALLLQRDPTLTQARVVEILQAGARYPSHPDIQYEYQLGPGELDLPGAVAAMAAEPESGAPPDPALSWYTLSSGYARPDPSWPVWGTLELRRSDGSLAAGLDATKLAVQVRNGRVHTQPVKVRHGLWRFAVAGEVGTTGERLELGVSYAGVPISVEKSLPIGADVWGATRDFDAIGGTCACRAAGGGAAPRGALPAALLLAGLLLRRRRGR